MDLPNTAEMCNCFVFHLYLCFGWKDRGGTVGLGFSPALPAPALPSDLFLEATQVGEQPIKLGNERTS